MLGRKSMSGVRDVVRGGNLALRTLNLFTPKVAYESFLVDAVLADACRTAGVAPPSNPENDVDNYRWWTKLCQACADKTTTAHGGKLLRSKVVNALSQKLAIDELYRLNRADIEKETIRDPVVVMGIPRSNGHMAAHVLSRSGLFLAPRQCDTWSPSLLLAEERRDAFHAAFRGFGRLHTDFLCVRVPGAEQIDDDLTMHLMVPQSYAWGLLHGLDEYLLETLEEDQRPVFEQVKRTLQLFQWYKRMGHFSESVTREVEPINNPMETQTYGTKNAVIRPQWLIYSPFAILCSDALAETFPDMRAIWVHRALSQCLPSLCSSLCLHNSLYTGKPPSDSQLAATGEKVLGIFGSGTEYAIDFYGNFDQRRMAHWSNRDVKRHAARVAGKTLDYFGIELDRYRRLQMINGQTEYTDTFRPLHDAQMPYFCIHDGIIGDVFQSYVHQFEEFAFEKRIGVTIKEYQSLTSTNDQTAMRSLQTDKGSPNSGIAAGQPTAGHYLQEGKAFR